MNRFDNNRMELAEQLLFRTINRCDEPRGLSRQEERRLRRILKENKIYGHLPRTTPKMPKLPAIDMSAAIAAYERKHAGMPPPMVHIYNPRVFITDAAGNTTEMCPSAEPSATAEVTEGSVRKRPRVDAGEASQIVDGNLNPGQDSSVAGTKEDVKGGSVLNKDLGGSSEIVVNNLNHPGEEPFADASGNT